MSADTTVPTDPVPAPEPTIGSIDGPAAPATPSSLLDDCLLLDGTVLPPGSYFWAADWPTADGSTRLSFQPCSVEPVPLTAEEYPPPVPATADTVAVVEVPPSPLDVQLPETGAAEAAAIAWVAAAFVLVGLGAVYLVRRQQKVEE